MKMPGSTSTRNPHPNPSDDCLRAGKGKGVFTFAAANGDILKASYAGTAVHWSLTDVDIAFVCTIIEGGTGKFEDAEGYFDWVGKFNPEENMGLANIAGKIKY